MAQNRIKIAHILGSRLESLSGGDLVILNLLKYLNRNIFEPYVINFFEERRPGIPLMVKEARERGIKTFIVNAKGRFDLGTVRQIKRFIAENKIDIIHCHGYKADVICALLPKKLNIKKITTLHGWWIGKSIKLKFYNWLDHLAIRNFDKIMVVSEPMKIALIRRHFPLERVIYIPNGVDLDWIHSANGEQIREELNLTKDMFIIGIIGRLSKEKGHRYLLMALKDIPSAVLLIIGNGPLEKQLKKMAVRLKIKERVIFLGFRHDVNSLIAAIDIFVLPSLTEGLPLALLEAMAAEKPIIASNVGGIPNVIKDGETGILIKPKNPTLIEKAIIQLIDKKDFAHQIASNAKKLVEDSYSLKATTKRYEEVYFEVLKRHYN
ncbi:MAG: glycosyltransferase family 4 protein [Candidatus Omnitrophica bacterium]|nr:glycosyltransferase family 4 protein [Candidatus Omnitrophota bacterium]